MTLSKLGIAVEKTTTTDPQSGKEKVVYLPKSNLISGKEEFVQLPQVSRRQGTYIIGATGTGKSGLITNLVLQDIKQGKGVAVLDPHTDLTQSILARLPADRVRDVILLDALDDTHIFGLNLYQCDNPTSDELVQETYERVAHIFELLWLDEDKDSSFGPEITEGLLYSTYTLIYNSSTQLAGCGMLEIPILFREDIPRAKMLANIQDSTIRSFWENEYNQFDRNEKVRRARMVVNKINAFITNPIFRRIVGQSRTTINVYDIMEQGKILLVKLPGKFERMTEILGAMIIAQILAASYAREKQQKRRQFNIYADEFQRFATRDFAKLLTEASRKYNTPVTIAHQARDFIDLKNKAASIQVGNLLVLRIIDKDAQELAGNFYLEPEKGDTVERPVRTPVMEPIQYMVSHGIHPLEHTRTFIETYGKNLVELAKKEEDDERARLNEERRYEHDIIAGVRYIAPPQIQVTYHYRNLLKVFNILFYDAMKAGKTPENLEKTLDEILERMVLFLVDTFIQAFQRNKRGYRDSLAAYQAFVSERSGAVESRGVFGALVYTSGVEAVNLYSATTVRQQHDFDQSLKDGIIDALAEEFHATNQVWWDTIAKGGVEQSLFTESQVAQLPAPVSEAASGTALMKTNGVTGRKEALQTMLTKLPVALAKKTASLRRKEALAQKRLRDAVRKYLLSEVKAARANMLFVEKNGQFVTGKKEQDHVPRIYFPELFSQEELSSVTLQAQNYNRDALIIFQNNETGKSKTYDDIRRYWHVYTGLCHFFNTWEDAVSFYFHLCNAYWFRINPQTFFEKRNWQKKVREVYWRREYKGVVWDRDHMGKGLPKPYMRDKEDKKRLWLETWELIPGIEHTWVSPGLLESTIDQLLKEEANGTHAISHHLYPRDDSFLHESMYLETLDSSIIKNVEVLQDQWEEALNRTHIIPETAAIAAQEKLIEQELALLERVEAEKKVYDTFVAEFQEKMRQIMGELAMAPVEQESGLWTEKSVGHASYADTAGKLANELSNLPNFIAQVRITNEADELVEHTIRTLKPEQGLGEGKLKERIEWIKQHMIDMGYYRAKTEVDAEITKRHEALRQNGHQPPHKTSRKVDI